MKYATLVNRIADLEAELAQALADSAAMLASVDPMALELTALRAEAEALRPMHGRVERLSAEAIVERRAHAAARLELDRTRNALASAKADAIRLKRLLDSDQRNRWLELRDRVLAARAGAQGGTVMGGLPALARFAADVADQTYGPVEAPSQDKVPVPQQQLRLFPDGSHLHSATQLV